MIGSSRSFAHEDLRRIAPAIVAIVYGAMLPIAVMSANAMAPILAGLGILCAWLAWREDILKFDDPIPAVLVVIIALAVASAIWAHRPDLVPNAILRLAAASACGWCLVTVAARGRFELNSRIAISLALGLAITISSFIVTGIIFFSLLVYKQNFLTEAQGALVALPFRAGLSRGEIVAAIFLWPFALLLWKAGLTRIVVAFFVMFLIGASLMASFAPVLAVVAGAVGGSIFILRGGAWFVGGIVASLIVLMPSLTSWRPAVDFFLDRSWSGSIWHRAEIWRFVSERIAERPFLGWGMNGSRAIPGGQMTVDGRSELLPLHPHNLSLQIWLELGAIGALLLAALLLIIVGRIARVRDSAERFAAGATFSAVFAVAHVSFGIWQGWWLATIWLAAALVVATTAVTGRS
jgi:O-antigen ligase